MFLGRFRPNRKKSNSTATQPRVVQKIPELDEFLLNKDYQGAISLLEFKSKESDRNETNQLWLGYCYFRAGEYEKAINVYEIIVSWPDPPPEAATYLAICNFYLARYEEAKDISEKAQKSPLLTRLIFHISHRIADEKRLLAYHQQLGNNIEDQISLASIHFLRFHYAEAIEIFKDILQKQPKFIAINVYMAMCYFKLDYYDVASEVLAIYLKSFPDSPAALNLKACISYKAYTGKSVIPEIETLLRTNLYPTARQLITHNLLVFKNGDGALQVLPSMINEIPEARVNLIIYYLKKDQLDEAVTLCNELNPHLPSEFLIKAITYTLHGQRRDSKDHLKTAEQFFKVVGTSDAEIDTIPGRESQASAFFLQQKYDDVLVYLNSIKEFHQQNDVFAFNFAQALLMCKKYKQSEEWLLRITGPERDKSLYKFMLARCFIYNKKPHYAWDLLTKTSDPKDAISLIKIIAHDSYKAGEFFYAAKAFDQLEKSDPSLDNWQGKRGATAGLFRQLVHGKASNEQMSEILALVDTSHHPHAEYLSTVIREWARMHSITLDYSQ